jgi:hypothetical protein
MTKTNNVPTVRNKIKCRNSHSIVNYLHATTFTEYSILYSTVLLYIKLSYSFQAASQPLPSILIGSMNFMLNF